MSNTVYDKLLDAIAIVVNSDDGTWRERRDKVRQSADDMGLDTELAEFIGWWEPQDTQ